MKEDPNLLNKGIVLEKTNTIIAIIEANSPPFIPERNNPAEVIKILNCPKRITM